MLIAAHLQNISFISFFLPFCLFLFAINKKKIIGI